MLRGVHSGWKRWREGKDELSQSREAGLTMSYFLTLLRSRGRWLYKNTLTCTFILGASFCIYVILHIKVLRRKSSHVILMGPTCRDPEPGWSDAVIVRSVSGDRIQP